MSLENPMASNVDARKKNSLEQSIEVRIRWCIDSVVVSEKPDVPPNVETYLKGFELFLENLKEFIPEKEAELLELSNSVEAQSKLDEAEGKADVDAFVKMATQKVSDFFISNFTLEEIEGLFRRGRKMLNRLIRYEINGEKLDIHVPVTLVANAMELRSLFSDALTKLAEKFQNDPEFKDVKKVAAQSWIVVKVPKALEKFGFTITELDRENENGSAEISKEKLITIYGNRGIDKE